MSVSKWILDLVHGVLISGFTLIDVENDGMEAE